MRCRSCGTEIADKALICYKCGTATTDAKYQPYVAPRRRPRTAVLVVAIVAALLVLLAWFLLHSSQNASSRLDRFGDRGDLYVAAAGFDFSGPAAAPPAPPLRPGAGVHAPEHQDRRLPGGLRLLPAIGALP